jgi:single-stranded-DNA-specific exonuclease
MAAGCTFPASALPALTERLTQHVADALPPEELRPTLPMDAILDPSHVTLALCEALQALEPFGQGNPEPRFLLSGLRFTSLKRVGREFAHMQGTIGSLKCVGFHLGPIFERIPQEVDIACRIGIDTWNGEARPQLIVEDIREHVSVLAT